jgi:hypothetical protein
MPPAPAPAGMKMTVMAYKDLLVHLDDGKGPGTGHLSG